jgi:putative hydrolase of the HAD superfamily
MKALILDFGGPVLLTPFELVEEFPGTPAHALLSGRGPLASPDSPDQDWADLQAGKITEREYWDHRAVEWAALGGGAARGVVSAGSTSGGSIQQMVAHLYEPARPSLIRSVAHEVIDAARAAGHPVGVLTNDLSAFHTDEWISSMDVLSQIDVIVDGSVEGYLKPHPRLYELMSERLGVVYADMVFVDDQASNVRGAEALGIPTVHLDPRDPDAAYAETRKLLGLPAPG